MAAMRDSDFRAQNPTLGPHRKHSRTDPCPICDGQDSYCITFRDGTMICGNVESEPPAGLGHMHWPNGRRSEDWQERIRCLPSPAPRPVVDAELANGAYRSVLARLTLSDTHRTALHRRGLDDEQIARHGYVTSPATQEGRERLAAEIEREIGRSLAGVVPGFVRGSSGRTTLILDDNELLIPARDLDGRIHGIRRRPDNPGEKGKYLHFSAGFQPGKSVGLDGHAVHVASPRELLFADFVVIVEGEIKANIAADILGCIIISVPGVNNIGRVRETLAALNVSEVAIAYDGDLATNPKVALAENRLAQQLVSAGMDVARWSWPLARAKGLNDWLVAFRMPPRTKPHPAMQPPARGCR